MKKNSNVLIVTYPLGFNYGGILQAYALQATIKESISNVKNVYVGTASKKRRARSYLKSTISKSLVQRSLIIESRKMDKLYTHHTSRFVRDYIDIVDLEKNGSFSLSPILKIDAVVVGSDQVWRNAYKGALLYMLPFLSDNVKRISYAASFGVGDLSEFNEIERGQASNLLKKFKGISIREDLGVTSVNKLGLDGVQHVDPTLILEKVRYENLINANEHLTSAPEAGIFAYVLDRSGGKGEIISKVEKIKGLKSFEMMPVKIASRKDFLADPRKHQLPPVEQWLRNFKDSKFVVTDSFHGCVFSIIFNKPFVAIGNKSRGLARFTSLLSLFGLEDRLVSDESEVTDLLVNSKIDWKKVDEVKERERKRSLEYLRKYLGEKNE